MNNSLPIEDVLNRANLSRQALCDIVNKFIEKRDIEEVFHYTSASGLYGILTKNKLWFTRWDCLNDYSENKYIHNLIGQGLTEYESATEFVEYIKQINDLQKNGKKIHRV